MASRWARGSGRLGATWFLSFVSEQSLGGRMRCDGRGWSWRNGKDTIATVSSLGGRAARSASLQGFWLPPSRAL